MNMNINLKENRMQLEELTGDERTLVVVALQALYRQRVTAKNSTLTVCSLTGKEAPLEDIFGVREVEEALRRIGAAPEYH
ncbi:MULTISPECIES: hypothetical protein [Enterobacter]|uniref:hypothetical protein n=1 Tax=Enterobacter TaxID=547 RepID=UPI001FD43857|nr:MULTISPECIES: hypothetical protein [Enterobacter]